MGHLKITLWKTSSELLLARTGFEMQSKFLVSLAESLWAKHSSPPVSKLTELGEGKGYPVHHKCHQNMLGTPLPRGILLVFSTCSNATSTQESEKEMEAVVKLSRLLLLSTWKNTQKDWRAYTGKKPQMTLLNFFFSQFLWRQRTSWMSKLSRSTVPLKLECDFFSPTRRSAVSQVLTGNISWENIHFQSVVFTLLVHWSFDSYNALIVFLLHECL